MDNYKFLFPFEKVPRGSRVVIYGAGILGVEYYQQLAVSGYCQMVGFADREYEKYKHLPAKVYAPAKIHELDFDYVIIATRSSVFNNEITRVLLGQNVKQEQIIFVGERAAVASHQASVCQTESEDTPFAFQKSPLSAAFLLVGNFGDYIMMKRVIQRILELVPELKIDLYANRIDSFVRPIYRDLPQITQMFDDAGGMYKQMVSQYSLGISLSSFIFVDQFKEEAFKEKNADFSERIKRLQQAIKKEKFSYAIPRFVPWMRTFYRGKNIYTMYDYDHAFDYDDRRVSIPFDEQGEAEAEQFNLAGQKYITVNYGNGTTKEIKFISKQWPSDRFERVIELFKQKYADIKVVQIGGRDAEKLSGADCYVLGRSFEVVKHILKNTIFHFDIEGGLVHLATQMGVKCFVLFGPTREELFGYEQNVNIRAGKCGGCYGLSDDVNKCVRDMEQPACMYAITAELVMKHINNYLGCLEKV